MTVVDKNAWRLETPGHDGWLASPAPGADPKYFIVSADTHANEPFDVFLARVDEEYHPRLPRVDHDEQGNQWLYVEGFRPQMVRPAKATGEAARLAADSANAWTDKMEPDDIERMGASSTAAPEAAGLEVRYRDSARDGVDGSIVFPNRGLTAYATPDVTFSTAMANAWNRWAWEIFGDHNDTFAPIPMIVPGDMDTALAEIGWAAAAGFKGLLLPCRPIPGAVQDRKHQWNNPMYDPLWSAIADTGLPAVFHVATGGDPRAASGNGGAAINFVMGAAMQVMEPLTYILASGVLERHPTLRVVVVEAGVSWLPWLLTELDHAVLKHHMWSRPDLDDPPSEYFRRQCAASFIEEDPRALRFVEDFGLSDNILWSNDYPHQEGSWPHSPESIERQFQLVSEGTRRKALGENAARLFGGVGTKATAT
jgi:predicted TIM-barrel fold metal-dependent hydrolase